MADNTMAREFVVLGMMSGTSLDGLDLSVSKFRQDEASGSWDGVLQSYCSIPIPASWQNKIKMLPSCSAVEWQQAGLDWSAWCSECVQGAVDIEFLDLVVFSGQTVFHRPHLGWTGQLGNGAALYAGLDCRVPVVCDLRSLDVALGGQGAPLVPVADALLFPSYDACLNLGGFANVSLAGQGDRQRMAWDIGPCNLVLNHLAMREGRPFDEDGQWAAQGVVQSELWNRWMAISYHHEPAPKSLGTEWLETVFWPILNGWEMNHAVHTTDLLATATAYIASTIRASAGGKSTLVTGGGGHNTTLVNRLQEAASEFVRADALQVVLPEKDLIDGKEAHAFGFLGLLRALGVDNVWNSATGSSTDHLGGAMWGYFGHRGA